MIQDIRDIALNMLDATWPMLVISCLVATVLRITYLVTNGKKFVLYEELLKLFFIIYIAYYLYEYFVKMNVDILHLKRMSFNILSTVFLIIYI